MRSAQQFCNSIRQEVGHCCTMQGFQKRSAVLRGSVCAHPDAVLSAWRSMRAEGASLRKGSVTADYILLRPLAVCSEACCGQAVSPVSRNSADQLPRAFLASDHTHFLGIFDRHDVLVHFNLMFQLTVLRKFHILHIVSYGTCVVF